ncbi:GGDEF domain-containing protein [Rhizobium halophytocola]
MHQMGIDGLPRNYELVYEAYSGTNPDLVRDFIALGKLKTQEALDVLGQKYLPHHHEESVLAQQNGKVRSEMSNFISMLNEEKVSLSDYGRVIGHASRAMQKEGDIDPAELGNSISALRAATEKRASENSNVVRAVVNKTASLAELQREAEEQDATRFTDALTGLGTRRAFNVAISKVYANPSMPVLCGAAIGEIDDYQKLAEQLGAPVAERFLKQTAKVIEAVVGREDVACRFDGGRFGLLFYTGDQDEISRIIELVRQKLKATVINTPNGKAISPLGMSFGICLSSQAPNAFDLTNFSEKALATSKAAGGNTVTVYGASDGNLPKSWMIYQKDVRPA